MKVFLVENSYSSYVDRYTSIDKIFDSRAKAQEYIENVLNRMHDLKQIYDKLLDTDFDEKDNTFDVALEKFEADFPDTYWDSWDGNIFTIKEIGVE